MKNKKRTKTIEGNDEVDNLEDINMNEVTDSEEEYSENERKLLQKVQNNRPSENYDSDYEVYGLQNEDDEDQDNMEDEEEGDSMVSDIEGLQEDFDLPNEKAWGKRKKAYYSTDYVDPDYTTTSQKDLVDAEMEEVEAKNIQKRLAEQLDDADFGLDFMQTTKAYNVEIQDSTEQFVKTDLSKLTKRQKQAIMEKESPEFIALINDFKDRMIEAKDVLAPFLKLAKANILCNCPAVTFVKTKYDVLLNYCINISFYLMLKAKRLPVNSHPVIKRLAQYSQLLKQLESGQESLIQDIKEILKAKKQRKPLYNVLDGSKVSLDEKEISNHFKEKLDHLKKSINVEIRNKHLLGSKGKIENKAFMNEEEKSEDNPSVDQVKDIENDAHIEERQEIEGIDMGDLLMESEGKRGITYQMAKNKGLTPHRKKEQRNPRVKHRNKYRKAKIRRKGAVREVRKEITRYAGEISGIKASVKKSIKLK